MYLIIFISVIFVEIILRFTSSRVVDPAYSLKIKKSYLPAAHPPEIFDFSMVQHPWRKDQTVRIHRNRLGFRGRDLANSNERRVFLVGDSFFADHYHSEEECLTTQVEREINRVYSEPVIVNTTAFGGENNNDLLATLVHQVAFLSPDIIVVTPEVRNFWAPIKQNVVVKEMGIDKSFHWQNLVFMLLGCLKIVQWIFYLKGWKGQWYTYFIKGIRKIQWNYSHIVKETKKRNIAGRSLPVIDQKRVTGFIDLFQGVCKQLNCSLIVCHRAIRWSKTQKDVIDENSHFNTWLPPMEDRFPQHVLAQGEAEYAAIMKNYCQLQHISFIDLDTVVPKDYNHWVDDTHMELNGVKVVAPFIATHVAKELERLKG